MHRRLGHVLSHGILVMHFSSIFRSNTESCLIVVKFVFLMRQIIEDWIHLLVPQLRIAIPIMAFH